MTIFLDMDGVLNGHTFLKDAQSCTVARENVIQFNRILMATGAKVVLSSAWRYMIQPDVMGVKGFAYLLRTHGCWAALEIIGVTIHDEECAHCGNVIECDEECYKCQAKSTRADQVWRYIIANKIERPYVVIDDCDFGFTEQKLPFVQTDGGKGLTEADADAAIAILMGGAK